MKNEELVNRIMGAGDKSPADINDELQRLAWTEVRLAFAARHTKEAYLRRVMVEAAQRAHERSTAIMFPIRENFRD